MKPEQFVATMAYLAASYPHREVSRETSAVYAEFLADEPYEDVLDMARAHVARSAFFPTVSELIPPRPARDQPTRYYLPAPEPKPTTVNWPRRIIEQLKALEVGQRKALNRDGSWEDQ